MAWTRKEYERGITARRVLLQWNLYNAATVGPEKSDLIIEVAALF